MYQIVFHDEKLLYKDFSKIPESFRDTIFMKLDYLSEVGVGNAQVKKLKNYLIADYRLRVGDYRILFNIEVDSSKIILFRVLHRSKLY